MEPCVRRAALATAEAQTDDVLDVSREHFPLPTLGPELARITDDLINGRGVVLIRGVPVERYGKDRASAIYWGVGMHLGHPWPQNAKGHLLGDVTDQGRAVDDPTARGNEPWKNVCTTWRMADACAASAAPFGA